MIQLFKSVDTFLFSVYCISCTHQRSRETQGGVSCLDEHDSPPSSEFPTCIQISHEPMLAHCFMTEPVSPVIGSCLWTEQKHFLWTLHHGNISDFFEKLLLLKGLTLNINLALGCRMPWSPRLGLPTESKTESD